MKDIIEKILQQNKITSAIKKEYFKGLNVLAVRNKIEEMGLDRHMPIELFSTEIALRTPLGIIMQIRPADKNQLGMWGGALEDGENPEDGAVRELVEETGIKIDKTQLRFIEVHEHFHEYANHDKVFYTTYRYVVDFEKIPALVLNEESAGVVIVAHTIINDQQDFIKRLLGEK